MKMNKILGIGVALAGSALSVASALALYTVKGDDIKVKIGGYTTTESTGTTTYKFGAASKSYLNAQGQAVQGAEALSPATPVVRYQYPIGALQADDIAQQDFVLGNIAVSAKSAALPEGVSVSLLASIKAQKDASTIDAWYQTYANKATLFNGTLTTDSTTQSLDTAFEAAANPTIGSEAANEYIELTFTFAGLTDENFFSLAEGNAFDFTLKLGEISADFEAAYVVGSMTGWNGDVLQYRMVPNLRAENKYEWMYKNLSVTDNAEAKVVKGTAWSDGSNAKLAAGTTYDVYWEGSGEAKFLSHTSSN